MNKTTPGDLIIQWQIERSDLHYVEWLEKKLIEEKNANVPQAVSRCAVLADVPSWEECVSGIDDSRFTVMQGKEDVRTGARIMYDRIISLINSRHFS